MMPVVEVVAIPSKTKSPIFPLIGSINPNCENPIANNANNANTVGIATRAVNGAIFFS